MEKTTLVLGASPNPERYSNRAVKCLQSRNIPVIAIGLQDSEIGETRIIKGIPENTGYVHTVTLYMNAGNQAEYQEFVLSLNPKRIIFNPGTWNPELAGLAEEKGIEVVDGCMLVMLSCGMF